MNDFDDDPTFWTAGGTAPRDLRVDDEPVSTACVAVTRRADTSALPRLSDFEFMAGELGAFIHTTQRWPRVSSSLQSEVRLAHWSLEQIDARLTGRLPNTCKRTLDRAAPGWLFARQNLILTAQDALDLEAGRVAV